MKSARTKCFAFLLALVAAIQSGCTGAATTQKNTNGQGYQGIVNFVRTRVSDDNEAGRKVAVQPDGKIVAAGWIERSGDRAVAIVRYLTDGRLDPTFANGGIAIAHIPGTSFQISDLLIQPLDGKVLFSGMAYEGGLFYASLGRFAADGSLDSSFGIGGIVKSNFGIDDSHFGGGLALQGDRIVAAGAACGTTSGNPDFLVARYLTNGTLDTTFGSGGSRISAIGPAGDIAAAVGIDSQSRIVLAGTSEATSSMGSAVARYTSSGALDSTFGTGGSIRGKLVMPGNDSIRALLIQADDKIVVAGAVDSAGRRAAIFRLNLNGAFDTSFGVGGKYSPELGAEAHVSSLQATADGKILAGGAIVQNPSDPDFLVLRINSNGSLDSTFGDAGKAVTHVSDYDDRVNGMALQADGKILTVGATFDKAGDYDFALARYNADGSPDGSFSGDR